MDVTINARHCTVPESTRTQAAERLQRLARYEPRAGTAQVLFFRDGHAPKAEALVSVPGRARVIARATGDTFSAALDRAVERLERQLLRRRQRRTALRTATAGADQ
jgi:ribosomal subunit interface protein